MAIGTGCIGSCKSNYHTITATSPLHRELYIFKSWCRSKNNEPGKMKVLMVVGPARVNVLLSCTIKGYVSILCKESVSHRYSICKKLNVEETTTFWK